MYTWSRFRQRWISKRINKHFEWIFCWLLQMWRDLGCNNKRVTVVLAASAVHSLYINFPPLVNNRSRGLATIRLWFNDWEWSMLFCWRTSGRIVICYSSCAGRPATRCLYDDILAPPLWLMDRGAQLFKIMGITLQPGFTTNYNVNFLNEPFSN